MTDAGGPRPDGWATHQRMQLEAALATTPQERLRWLEEAIRFAFAAGALPRRDRSAAGDRSPSLEDEP